MTEKRVTIDDLAATTKNALDRIEAKMATKDDLNGINARLAALEETSDKSLRIQKAMLTNLELLEERFRASGDHEERLQRLEHTVFSTRNKGRQ